MELVRVPFIFQKLLPKHNLGREDIYIVTKANIRSLDVEENARQMVQNSLDSLQTKLVLTLSSQP